MPTYNNPINLSGGFKLGVGSPIDDRYIFDSLLDAETYIATNAFFMYEGLWAYLIDPGDYYVYQRVDPSLPWNTLTNPFIWKRFSTSVGGLPPVGQPDQQLIMNSLGTEAIYEYYDSRGLFRFVGAVTANPAITAGMFVRHITGNTFEDVHTPANYPINAVSKLPLYFVFYVDGDDLIVGKSGVYKFVAHNVSQRVPIYLDSTYINASGTYYTDVLTATASTVDGEINLVVGNAIDSNYLFIDLTRTWDVVTPASGGGTGNAVIQRDLIQRSGTGGAIPEDPDGFYTIPHGFGDQRGIVQVTALNTVPPVYTGGSGNERVTADAISFESNAVRLRLDYGASDPNLTFEVVLIF